MSLSIAGRTSSNVGQIQGDNSKGVIKRIAIFGGKLSAADTADAAALQAALAAASSLPKSDPGKLYWLPEVQNFEDKSEQNTTGALNLGPTVMLKEGKPGYEIRVDGSSEFAKAMRKYNNKSVSVLEFDSNNQLWGRKSGTDFHGYSAKIFVNAMKVASGQAPEEGIVTVTVSFMSSTEYGDQAKCVDLSDVDTSLIKTQVDAKLRFISKSSNVHKIAVEVELGEMNQVFDCVAQFGAAFTASLFEAGTGAGYATPLVITSVAPNATGSLDVTFDSTAYTALAANTKIQLNLKAPSVLEAANVTDIEGVAVILTK